MRRATGARQGAEDGSEEFLAFYDGAVAHVYGYLASRCRQRGLAEELTSETFLAAVDAARRDAAPALTVAWAIGVARHKLADHWRRQALDERRLRLLEDPDPVDDTWDAELDALRARATLDSLAPQHRAALTLRYLDDLPVTEVADVLGRSVHATEALLARSRSAFRRAYEPGEVPGA